MPGRVVRDVHRPKQAAIVPGVVEHPVQKILHYNQHKPIQKAVVDLKKPELISVVEDQECAAGNYQVLQKGKRG